MTKNAIVSFLWGKNLPAVLHYLERRPCTVLAVSGQPAAQAREQIQAAGGELVLLDRFLDAERFAGITSAAESAQAWFADEHGAAVWRDFCERRGLDAQRFGAIVGQQMKPRLEEQMVLIEVLDRAREAYDIELVVVNEDITRWSWTVVAWAKERGVPSLHVSHGTGLANPYTVHKALHADAMAVFGQRGAEGYEDIGIDPARLRVTGNPAWDLYANSLFLRPAFKQELKERYGLKAAPVIVFGTTWAALLSADDDQSVYEDGLRAFLQTIRRLKSIGRAFNCVIKDRPPNAAFGRQQTERIAAELGLGADDYLYATDEAAAWVLSADVVVAIDSNLSIEAMLAGVPSVNLLTETGLRMGPSFDADAGILEVPEEELADILIRLLDDDAWRARLSWQMKKSAPRYNAGVDGKATERVAQLMLEMARKPASAGGRKVHPWQSLGGTAGEREEHEVYMDNPRREVVGMFEHPPRRVLEIGCSTGATGQLIKELYPSAYVFGIELSAAAARQAATRIDRVITRKFEEADLPSEGIKPGSIDTVILADVLEHMYDPWSVLVRLRPYLTPDAQVVASIPNVRNLWLMNELAHGRFSYDLIGLLDITHIRFFTLHEIGKLFEETGYRVVRIVRNLDPRLARLEFQEGMDSIETEKLVLKDVSRQEFEELQTLQFVVLASPSGTEVVSDTTPDFQSTSARKRLVVYSLEYPPAACAQIRLLRPFSLLQDEWEVIWAVRETEQGATWDGTPIADADLILLHRIFPGPNSERLLEAVFHSGKPVIYETDDLLTELPESNMHFQDWGMLRPYIEDAIRRADAVVVSTGALAEALRPYNAVVHVLPNLVDFDLFHRTIPPIGAVTTIGVVGTSTRMPDFDLIERPLRDILDRFGKRVQVKFLGDLPRGWERLPNVTHVPFAAGYEDYARILKAAELDIVLAPLADHPFNRAKSPIKWLEMSACGVAGVFSRLDPYQAVVRHGETGLLADESPDQWRQAIAFLIEHPEKRREMALKAQIEVLRRHSLKNGIEAWREFYSRLPELARTPAVEARPDWDTAASSAEEVLQDVDLYPLWQHSHSFQERDARWIAENMAIWTRQPVFHFAAIVPEMDAAALESTLRSLARQIYAGWRLTLVAHVPMPDALAGLPGVAWVNCGERPPLEAVNDALIGQEADWVGMFELGDQLAPHATFSFGRIINRHPEWRFIFTDEDALLEDGSHTQPYFKNRFDIDLLRAAPFALGGLLLCERALFQSLGGFRIEAEGVEYFDLALRAWESLGEAGIGHVEDVLYHRAIDGGHCRRDAEALALARKTSLEEHLRRVGLDCELGEGLLPGTYHVRHCPAETQRVSILIPVDNRPDVLRRCIESLVALTEWPNFELLLLATETPDADTTAYLALLQKAGGEALRVLDCAALPNPAAVLNAGAQAAGGPYLLFLAPDSVIVQSDWLTEMVGHASRPDIGAVGARLLDEAGNLRHAGLLLGYGDKPAGNAWAGQPADQPGYFGRLLLPRRLSAVSAACLLTRKTDFEALGGFDAQACGWHWFDVDYCLRLAEQGKAVLWTPHATLVNGRAEAREALPALRGGLPEGTPTDSERHILYDRWLHQISRDRAYNRNLCLVKPDVVEISQALTWDPEWRPRPRVMAIHADTMGCGEYRIIAPLRALATAGRLQGWSTGSYVTAAELARADPDAIVFQRQVTWEQIEIMSDYIRHSRAFRVFEIDDLITNLPIRSSQKKVFVEQKDLNKRFRKAVGLCQRFVVSTAFLAEEYRGYADEVVVVPNFLEAARWAGHAPRRRMSAKPRVGWAGSPTHAGDLALVLDVVKATAKEVDWVFMGMCPEEIRPYVREFHPPVKLPDYPAKLASLNLDLAIAPLEDIPFNHGKSHLRLLEYGVLGFPVICSDLTPYRGDYPVTRVRNRFKDWVEAIRSHVADLDATAQQGDRLREYVREHWMLEDHLDVWLKAWLP